MKGSASLIMGAKSGVRIHSRVRFFTAIFLLILLLAFATVERQVNATQGASVNTSVIWGQILDAATGRPIENATIAVWEIRVIRERWRSKTVTTLHGVTQTGSTGRYEFFVDRDATYRVYAYSDDPRSPGYDYVPQVQSVVIEAEDNRNLSFTLVPGASILFEGDVLFVDSSQPPEAFGFTVVPEVSLPASENAVLTYGTTQMSHSYFLNVNPMHVIIPTNMSVTIEVVANVIHTFVIDDPQFSHVEKGEEVLVKVGTYTLPFNINLTRAVLQQTEVHINETEQVGFYVTAERRDLDQVSSLLEGADAKFVEGRYEECYADLREAYTKVTYIDAKVQFMYVDASTSTLIIIVFLAFTSVSLAYLLYEAWVKKTVATGLFYSLFMAVLFYVYSGCRIVGTTLLLQIGALTLLGSLLTPFLLSRFTPTAVTALFSMAKRNLKRRRTRFLLTLVTVTALVMSFVALTSFSTEYGFTSTTIQTVNLTSDGLLIRKPLPTVQLTAETEIATSFDPLDTLVLDWLHSKPQVSLVAPKFENWPTRRPLGTLSTPGQRQSIFGVLGLSPTAEAEVTGFNQLLVEGQGRYLNDDEEDVIMLSMKAADALNVQVGDQIQLRIGGTSLQVTVVGFLDDHGLSQILDFDGSPLMPDKLIITVEDGVLTEARIEPCVSTEVVVTNWRTALKLPYHVFLSRIDVLVADAGSLLPFARQIALERDYWVWTAEEGRITHLGLMTYLEAKGVSVFIPWSIVILNVVFTMVNAIYERRGELVILSSVGLNPSHITALFVAEALIVGVIGGGMGYLLGLSLYQLMPLLSISVFVRQKISAVWCLASLGIALTAVLVGAFVALKTSVDITPSTLRRWTMGESHETGTPWTFDVPFRVQADRVDSLFENIATRFRRYLLSQGINEDAGRIEFLSELTPDESIRTIHFKYLLGETAKIGALPFQLVAKKRVNEDVYTFEIVFKGAHETIKGTVNFIRRAIIEWSSQHNSR